MMRCSAIKSSDGKPCMREAQEGKEYCWGHDPENRQALSDAGRKGGALGTKKDTPVKEELRSIRSALYDLTADLRKQRIPASTGAVLVQTYNALIRTLEAERKIEAEDLLEAKLIELEDKVG